MINHKSHTQLYTHNTHEELIHHLLIKLHMYLQSSCIVNLGPLDFKYSVWRVPHFRCDILKHPLKLV